MSVCVCCYSFYPACPFFGDCSFRWHFCRRCLLSFFYPVPSFLFLFAVCLFPACSLFSACPFSLLVPFGGIFAAGAFFLWCLLSLSLSHRAGFALFILFLSVAFLPPEPSFFFLSGAFFFFLSPFLTVPALFFFSDQRSGLDYPDFPVCTSLFRLPFAWLKTVPLKASLKNRYKITNNF